MHGEAAALALHVGQHRPVIIIAISNGSRFPSKQLVVISRSAALQMASWSLLVLAIHPEQSLVPDNLVTPAAPGQDRNASARWCISDQKKW